MDRNIYLIGFMGVGKSTVSRELAQAAGYGEIDTDAWIERDQGKCIAGIFEEQGEEYFRALETDLLKELRAEHRKVVSCGGGMALREENVALMRQGGAVAWLTAKPETILERVGGDTSRPLLRGNMDVGRIRGMMEQRRPFYRAAADFTVSTDGKPSGKIAEEILKNCFDLFHKVCYTD